MSKREEAQQDATSDVTRQDGTSRRDFLKKNLKRSALLPYVVPAIETIYLPRDAHAQGPSTIGNTDPNAPPHPIRHRSSQQSLPTTPL